MSGSVLGWLLQSTNIFRINCEIYTKTERKVAIKKQLIAPRGKSAIFQCIFIIPIIYYYLFNNLMYILNQEISILRHVMFKNISFKPFLKIFKKPFCNRGKYLVFFPD